MPYLSCMATTTTKEQAMTTTHLYLNDDGRCTCADHAGMMLAASIKKTPDAQFHTTTDGTWEDRKITRLNSSHT